jgi:lipopolysaccharide biosynthesis glycosyltransferase
MKVFVGWDSREDIAYQVCKHSIVSRNDEVEVTPLKQQELNDQGIYDRDTDQLSSTEFTFTRFLVPYLTNYEGWAIFCDCDIIFIDDIQKLFSFADEKYAVMVVKHDYTPQQGIKMDGKVQFPYPRKNWSSVILFNCGHPSNKALTPDLVNSQTGQFLHRFQWLEDEEIGELHHEWNWLVNWYHEPDDGKPKAIHYTEGGPWFDNYKHCEYGYHWEKERYSYEELGAPSAITSPYDNVPEEIKSIFDDIIKYRVDPFQEYYTASYEKIIRDIKMLNNNNVHAVEGARDSTDLKGLAYDPFLQAFVLGAGGQITSYSKTENNMTPVVFRGITKIKHMRACEAKGRDYYYIDTGYFGNVRKKLYHRITKNSMQNIGPIIERPFDRLELTGWRRRKFRPGTNILICPPSKKAMSCFGLDLETWMTETIDLIKQHTDRPIIIREKLSRRERTNTDTMEMALARDVHCLVTFNSIAASEALLYGKPAFTLGPNAAQALCKQDLTQIENPHIPTVDELEAWAAHLAYCQFTEAEMSNGTAWKILNETSDIPSSDPKK